MSSFLSGILGNKGADSFVDQAVDKAAVVAKKKVKDTLAGKSGKPAGGTGGVAPNTEDKKPKEKPAGGQTEPMNNSGGGSKPADNTATDSNFNDALDDLAKGF